MRKLTLRIDDLAVESFPTEAAGHAAAAGTVRAHAETRGGAATCNSCLETCDTCHDTCGCPGTRPRITCLDPCLPSGDVCV